MNLFRTRKTILAAIGLAVVLFISPAFAQNTVRVQIPFDFQAGDQLLPAGKYIVSVDAFARRLDVRSAYSTKGTYLGGALVNNPDPALRGALMFHQYGDKYFLRTVAVAGQSIKYQIAASRAEREMARTRTSNQLAMLVQ